MSTFTKFIILLSISAAMSLPLSGNVSQPSNHTLNQTPMLGGCVGTMYGCCRDNFTPCVYKNCSNCLVNVTYNNTPMLGGCVGTMYGCCRDNFTPCVYKNCSNCLVNVTYNNYTTI